jgi:hypothetical protein
MVRELTDLVKTASSADIREAASAAIRSHQIEGAEDEESLS